MRKILILCIISITGIATIYMVHVALGAAQKIERKPIFVPVQIERLEKSILNCQNKEALVELLKHYPLLLRQFWGIENATNLHLIAGRLYALNQDAAIQELYKQVFDTFKDLSTLTKELTDAFNFLQDFYPDFTPPQVITLITGMDADVFVSKEIVVISLDCFLGDKAKWKPQLPDYILYTYQPAYIASKVIAELSFCFNTAAPNDNTLLHDMLYQGKAYYFMKMLLPHCSEAMLLGYTATQIEDTIMNKRIVWKHFIDHELLYTTNHIIKKKYLTPRPFTGEIGTGCPGNIGGWLGFEIIKKYMKHNPHITLSQLMQNTNTQDIFLKAKYKP